MNSLKNKTVFITGASLGFGKLTAFNFAKEKCRLALTYYKDEKEAREVEKKCKELGSPEVLMLKLNVRDNRQIQKTVKEIVNKYKSIDILVNNAGVVVWEKFQNSTQEEIDAQIETNFVGLINMTKSSLQHVNKMIINIASVAGLEGYSNLAVYCATKFGVRGFTQSLAQEISKIKIYSVNPGTYATRMNDFHGRDPQEVADLILNLANGKINKPSGSDVNTEDYFK